MFQKTKIEKIDAEGSGDDPLSFFAFRDMDMYLLYIGSNAGRIPERDFFFTQHNSNYVVLER